MMSASFPLSAASLLELVFAAVAGFGALLLRGRSRYRALAGFLAFESLLMLLNLYEENSAGLLITPVFTLAKGPLIYLVVRGLVNERRLAGFTRLLHLAVPLVPVLLGMDARLAIALGSASQIAYLAASFRLLRRYHRAANDAVSDADSRSLGWVATALWMLAIQAVLALLRLNLQPIAPDAVLRGWYGFDLAFLFAICCFLILKAARQPHLYDDLLAHERATEAPARRDEEAAVVFGQLDATLRGQRLFATPRFRVEDLSALTGLGVKDVSWAFNAGGGASFNAHINHLRIEEVKRALQSPARTRSVLQIAMDAGFNSKSSFNAAFRREVGMTPTAYLRSLDPAE